MLFTSTRSSKILYNFSDVLLSTTSKDGGLFFPQKLKPFSNSELNEMSKMEYEELCFVILRKFIAEKNIPNNDLSKIINSAYSGFYHKAVVPTKQISKHEFIAELFYGKTFAFKDMAMSVLGGLIEYELAKQNKKAVILGATSGDTGSAAIYGCKNISGAKIFILFPKGGVSNFQRRQMTTTNSANVFPIEVDGNFDDCQNIIRTIFEKNSSNTPILKLPQSTNLIAVNSINFFRIVAQVVYNFYIYFSIGGGIKKGSKNRKIAFSIPTGNFGNVFSGIVAKELGMNVDKFIVSNNENNTLFNLFSSGVYSKQQIVKTISPSIDISIATNIERLLYRLYNNNPKKIEQIMSELKNSGSASIEPKKIELARKIISSYFIKEDEVIQTIKDIYNQTGEVIDTHTAIAVAAGRNFSSKNKEYDIVNFATAHPVKFLDYFEQKNISNIAKDINLTPKMREDIKSTETNQEKYITIENNINKVISYIESLI